MDDWETYVTGGRTDDRLRNRLIERELPAAYAVADGYCAGSLRDDCRQAAAIGLLAAANSFDPTYGTPFFGFARSWVVGEVKRVLSRAAASPVIEQLESAERDDGRDPPGTALASDEEFRRLTDGVTLRQQTCAYLACFVGLSTREIAKTLAVSQTLASGELRAVRETIRRKLDADAHFGQ